MSSGFGPGFQDARSRLYRLEYGVLGLAVIVYLIWRSVHVGGVDWLEVAFWAILPDLIPFAAIGASSKRKEWPSWGATLYNVFHSLLTWGAVFAASWVLLGGIYWPLFGWLGHIALDRAVGYGLRASPSGRL